jgi:hypothetical protein
VGKRGVLAVGASVTVVLAAISGGLVNEIHRGWPWWIAAGGVILAGAALTGALSMLASSSGGDHLAEGAVKADRDIRGPIETDVEVGGHAGEHWGETGGDRLGPGAVKAGRDISGSVTTRANSRSASRRR